MKAFGTIRILLILAGISTLAPSAWAANDRYLDGLSGNWRGKGFITTALGAKEEAIRCRLRNKTDVKNHKVVLSGNCGVGGVVIPMGGWIAQSGKSRTFKASLFKSMTFLRIDSFTGKLSGKRLKLNFKGKDKVNKEDISAFITINAKGKNSFDIILSSTDTKSKKLFKVGTIKFSRK